MTSYPDRSRRLVVLPYIPPPDTLIAEFLKQYDQNHFETLAKLVVNKFKKLPPTDPPIKYQSSYRAKDPQSLSGKLHKLYESQPFDNMQQIYSSDRLWDLAGIRVLAYFPDDVPSIAKQISSLFKVLGKPIVVHSKRGHNEPEKANRTETVTSDTAHLQFEKYQKGSWSTKKSLDSIGTEWKHAGYRAIHFHVEVNDNQASYLMPWQKRVEVQVSTVVMHAWSEVEHDIIYKNPFGLPNDPTMDRMVDAINGLAITSEILLQELQQTTLDVRKKDAELLTPDLLSDWLFEFYLDIPIPLDGVDDVKDDERNQAERYIDFVIELLWSPIFEPSLTRKNVRALIPKRDVESRNPCFLLQELLKNLHGDIENLTREVYLTPSPSSFEEFELPGQQLYTLLLASSSYSIAAELDPKGEWWNICRLSKSIRLKHINRILTGKRAYSRVPQRTLNRLELYAESFLNCSCCDTHEVANKLAKLSWYITTTTELEIDSPVPPATTTELEIDSPPVPATPISFNFLANTVGLHEPPGRRLRGEIKETLITKQRRLPPSLGQIIEDNEWWKYYEEQQDLDPWQPMRELDFMWFHPIDIRHYIDCILRDVDIDSYANDDPDAPEEEHDPNASSPENSDSE